MDKSQIIEWLKDLDEMIEWLKDLDEMFESKGKHEGHTLEQVGRCVYCSCGKRVQGRLPKNEHQNSDRKGGKDGDD